MINKPNSVFIFLLFFQVIYPEYLVYKKTNNGIELIANEKEYEKIYSILMNYQWPMVIGYAHHMNKTELQEISNPKNDAEENFLRKKLKDLSSDYDIGFIPDIIYQLHVIIEWCRIDNKKEEGETLTPEEQDLFAALAVRDVRRFKAIDNEFIDPLISNPSSTRQQIYDKLRESNNNPSLRIAHQKVNNSLIHYLTQKNYALITNISVLIKQRLPDFIKNVSSLENRSSAVLYNFIKYLSYPGVLEKFVNFESDAHNNNQGLLYRGGRTEEIYMVGSHMKKTPIEAFFLTIPGKKMIAPSTEELQKFLAEKSKSLGWTPWHPALMSGLSSTEEEFPLGSVSYGNSVLAGYLNDTNACVAYYISQKRLGYSLYIDKKQFLSGNLSSLFYISIYNSLASLFATGEFFHSRTISYASKAYESYFQKDPQKKILLAGMDPVFGGITAFDKAGIFMRIGDPLQQTYELSNYIQSHAIIVKLPEMIREFFPPENQVTSYFEAQKEMSSIFKAMFTLRKYAVARKVAKQKEPIAAPSLATQKREPVKLIPKTKPAPAQKSP